MDLGSWTREYEIKIMLERRIFVTISAQLAVARNHAHPGVYTWIITCCRFGILLLEFAVLFEYVFLLGNAFRSSDRVHVQLSL